MESLSIMKKQYVVWAFMAFICISIVISAQNESCSEIVTAAIETVGDACDDLGRNEICYGNVVVDAQNFDDEPLDSFVGVGDIVDVAEVSSLSTGAFDANENIWGVAALSLQGNIPDTVPGQNVTFIVFGATQLSNQVSPDGEFIARLSATSTGNINVRSGPGTTFDVIDSLGAEEELTLISRDESGEWVQIESDAGDAWVFASLLTIDGELSSLAGTIGSIVVEGYSAPMQAFTFRSGVGQSDCEGVPPDGILLQAPTNTTVNFLVNGIEIEVGSTAFIQFDQNTLNVNTFDGTVDVSSSGTTEVVEPGYVVSASTDTVPTSPTPYDYAEISDVPISLLPEEITIPILISGSSNWIDTGIEVAAGDTFELITGGTIDFWADCETRKFEVDLPDVDCSSLDFGPEGGDPLLFNGEPVESDMSIFPVENAPPHSLVGRIGDSIYYVGSGGEFIADDSGTLEFRANDFDDNNSGEFSVSVVFSEES